MLSTSDYFRRISNTQRIGDLEREKCMTIYAYMERVEAAVKLGRDFVAIEELKAMKAIVAGIQAQIDAIRETEAKSA